MTTGQSVLTGPVTTAADDGASGRGATDAEPDRCRDECGYSPLLAEQLRDQLELMRQVFDARAIIEQAKGMLMAEHRMSADRAFELLRERSQITNTKLRDVAAHHVLLNSGQFAVRQARRS
ncbi:MAG: ANTAR domain-containing protein [Nakamurella sp.]